MKHNRQYGNDDQQVKRLLEKYRQRPNSQLHQNQFPQYSAVKHNNQHENVLGASEVSWLDKMAEINEKLCDETVCYGRDEGNVFKSANSMKFSFNQNYQTQAKQDQKKVYNGSTKAEGHQSVRDIYMKEMEKESEKIKEVQKARQQILNSIGRGYNKQNQVGPTGRKNWMVENTARNEGKLQKRVSFGFETIQLPKNIIVEKKKQKNKQQEMNSLHYLQESLAKTKRFSQKPEEPIQKIQITKKNYLQLSSNVKAGNVGDSHISIREFNQKEVIFTQLLQKIFDTVDKCNIGKLDNNNCHYEDIEDVFKIVFGSIFSRIKFKNLSMNRQEFVKIGLQIIKELQSEELNTVIERTIKADGRQQKYTKDKGFYCQKCQNKIQKVVSFSPEKSAYINRNQQNSQKRNENYVKQQSPLGSQLTKQKSNNRNGINTERISQESQYKSYKDEKISRQKQSKSKSKLGKTMYSNTNEINNQKQRRQTEKTMNVQYKKKRNISQSMIAQHKRNLQDLVFLSQQMQNCLTVSRKFTSQSQKVSQYCEFKLIPSYEFLQ